MKNSKLISLLQEFNPKEWRAFKNFIASPYYNKSEEIRALYEYLKETGVKSFPEHEVERKVVFKKLYPDQAYDDKALNHLMSQLFQLAERFLSIEAFEKDGVLPDYYLLSTYVERKMDKQYQLAIKRANKKLNNAPFRDESYHFQEFLLADIEDQHFQSAELRVYDNNLEKAAAAFDKFYFSKKLKYLVAKVGWEKIISRPFDKPMIKEIMAMVEQYNLISVPPVIVYFQLLQMLTTEDSENNYLKFKEILDQNAQLFPEKEIRNLYSFLSNYCVEKIRHGEKKFTKELMDVYMKGLEDGFFLEDGEVSPWLFKNMVTLGIGQKRFAWTEGFISAYAPKLPADKQKDAYNYSMADTFYAQNKYDDALGYLNLVEFTDVHYSLGAKELLLKIYYTTNETEAFLSLVFSFKIFLKRNKLITRDRKAAYENFIRFIHQLQKSGNTNIDEFERKVNLTKSLTARNWLLQQVSLLKET
jgi:hypothetical protein